MSSRGNVGMFRVDFETVSDRRPHLGAGKVAELGKCLLCKNGDLSSIPRTHVKKRGVLVCVFNSREAGVGDPWYLLPINLANRRAPSSVKDSALKKKVGGDRGGLSRLTSGLQVCSIQMWPHTRTVGVRSYRSPLFMEGRSCCEYIASHRLLTNCDLQSFILQMLSELRHPEGNYV